MNLRELGKEGYENALQHGFRGGDEPTIPYQLALMHKELSSALEHWRDDRMQMSLHNGKPTGFPVELADIIIRVTETAYVMGIDLDEVVAVKMKYNTERPMRHGRKR
jgi:hypothetical protein